MKDDAIDVALVSKAAATAKPPHIVPSPRSQAGSGSAPAGGTSAPAFPPAAWGALLLAFIFVWGVSLLLRAARRPLTAQMRDAYLMLSLKIALFIGLVSLFFCPGLSVFAWVALELIALGLFGVGFVVGFLFGVPEYVKEASPITGTGTASLSRHRQLLQPNSNISKVSDWLTTAITAVTLSQIVLVPKYIATFGTVLEGAFQLPHYGTALAVGLALYFPSLGFMTGFMVTTIYLIKSMNEAAAALIPPDVQGVLKDAAPSDIPPGGGPPGSGLPVPSVPQKSESLVGRIVTGAAGVITPFSTSVQAAVDSATSVPLSALSSVDDKAAWARAQAVAGNYKDAILGFQQALALRPNDPDLLQNYASALFNGGADVSSVIDAYTRALRLVHNDPATKSRILANLALAYLYMPEGYTKALQCLDEALADPSAPKDPKYYFYRACANGQKWATLPAEATKERQMLHDSIMTDAGTALALEPGVKELFQMVSDPNYTPKDKEDCDLEAFAASNDDYRDLIGLKKGENSHGGDKG